MDFDRLDLILKERGISRRKLALAVGILPGTMSTAFMRRSGLSSADVLKIAEYLGVSPYYLEGQEGPEASDDGGAFERWDYGMTNVKGYKEEQRHKRILTAYDKLNGLGQAEAVKRVEELTEIPRYTRSGEE